jgi:hypothetical protein
MLVNNQKSGLRKQDSFLRSGDCNQGDSVIGTKSCTGRPLKSEHVCQDVISDVLIRNIPESGFLCQGYSTYYPTSSLLGS